MSPPVPQTPSPRSRRPRSSFRRLNTPKGPSRGLPAPSTVTAPPSSVTTAPVVAAHADAVRAGSINVDRHIVRVTALVRFGEAPPLISADRVGVFIRTVAQVTWCGLPAAAASHGDLLQFERREDCDGDRSANIDCPIPSPAAPRCLPLFRMSRPVATVDVGWPRRPPPRPGGRSCRPLRSRRRSRFIPDPAPWRARQTAEADSRRRAEDRAAGRSQLLGFTRTALPLAAETRFKRHEYRRCPGPLLPTARRRDAGEQSTIKIVQEAKSPVGVDLSED